MQKNLLIKKLKMAATSSLKKAYSPYSGVKVGAALADERGRIFSGCNIENASYGLTICAERVAVVKAISSGSKWIDFILILSNLRGFAYPCGACRQFIAEFSNRKKGTEIILLSDKGKAKTFMLDELLPESFRLRRTYRK